MPGCLTGAAVAVLLLGLTALRVRIRHLRSLRPIPAVRGCVALVCLLVATGLLALAFLVSR